MNGALGGSVVGHIDLCQFELYEWWAHWTSTHEHTNLPFCTLDVLIFVLGFGGWSNFYFFPLLFFFNSDLTYLGFKIQYITFHFCRTYQRSSCTYLLHLLRSTFLPTHSLTYLSAFLPTLHLYDVNIENITKNTNTKNP